MISYFDYSPSSSRPSATVTSASASSTSAAAPSISESDHSYMNIEPSTSSSSFSDGTRSSNKYRRMRDLNNEASQRCRQTRKRKMKNMEVDEEELMARNEVLKVRCAKMESLVERLKKQFIQKVAKPRTPLDLDKIMADRLADDF
jgi:hypothetical protein